MNIQQDVNLNNSPLTSYYMPRARIERIFDRATRCKLVYVIAGAGYGKTRAVHNYIERHTEAVVRWLQLTESDNVGPRYWESLTHSVAFDNPGLAAKLREFGFPDTLARFRQFAEILKTMEHRSHKTYLVLDDFHLIRSKQALVFAERCAHLKISGACVIIISRTEPEINAVSLFAKGMASIITEDELRFKDDEIAEFLKSQDIPFSFRDLPRYVDATKGWALAVKLLSLVLARMPREVDRALEIMKQNVFKLLENEAWDDFPESEKKNLVRLSLMSDLPLTSAHDILDASFVKNSPQLASFMWFDGFIGDYRIHPLYHEFLQSRRDILSDEEKRATYLWAAEWCREKNLYLDAMKYYARSRRFDSMLGILLSYPSKLPYDACVYILDILEELERGGSYRDDRGLLTLISLFIPIMLNGIGRHEEAKRRTLDSVTEWERSGSPSHYGLLYYAYLNLAYIDSFLCTVTHEYNFPGYFKKSADYCKLISKPPAEVTGALALTEIRSFACLVGEGADREEAERFLAASRETAAYIADISYDMYCGYDDLVACELAFFKNQHDAAKNHARAAIIKAREKKQYSIEAMAEQYLLRIAVAEGDHSLTKVILKQLRDHLDNPGFWSRQPLYDLFAGFFFIQIGLPEMTPPWLVVDEKETAPEFRIPVRELIVGVKYHIAVKKYGRALTILCGSYPREPQERFQLGELTLSLLTAVCRFKTGDADGAILDFMGAYALSFDGELEMPFIELGKNLRPLAAAVLKAENCNVPADWIKRVTTKASIYAKKSAVVMYHHQEEKDISETVALSEREREVLSDMYHGLSREEIAVNRYLSVNTVKKILQSIYIKLDANNNIDAVRIAIEQKLIE